MTRTAGLLRACFTNATPFIVPRSNRDAANSPFSLLPSPFSFLLSPFSLSPPVTTFSDMTGVTLSV